MTDINAQEHCVLVLTPIGKDAQLTVSVLANAGIKAQICLDFDELLNNISMNFGSILITEEVLDSRSVGRLRETLKQQPPWSDIPLVLLTSRGESTEVEARLWETFASTGNVTILERPVRTSTLVSALQVALRSRRRQYQVRRLLEEQRAATRLRDEFISIASHELKTPLTALTLQTQLQQRQIEQNSFTNLSPEQVKKQIDQTSRQITRLVKLVEDMLDVSRIHVGKFAINREEFDFAALVNETIERFLPQLDQVGCRVILTTEPCLVLFDRYRMEQVLNNLFTNAIRYAPATPIKITLALDKSVMKLIFQDSGPGIARESLETIFQRFERGTSNTGISGLGLGLFICKEIVEAHGGTIRAESNPGLGAAFILTIPTGFEVAQFRPQLHAAPHNPDFKKQNEVDA